jgi:hypothetical protein
MATGASIWRRFSRPDRHDNSWCSLRCRGTDDYRSAASAQQPPRCPEDGQCQQRWHSHDGKQAPRDGHDDGPAVRRRQPVSHECRRSAQRNERCAADDGGNPPGYVAPQRRAAEARVKCDRASATTRPRASQQETRSPGMPITRRTTRSGVPGGAGRRCRTISPRRRPDGRTTRSLSPGRIVFSIDVFELTISRRPLTTDAVTLVIDSTPASPNASQNESRPIRLLWLRGTTRAYGKISATCGDS